MNIVFIVFEQLYSLTVSICVACFGIDIAVNLIHLLFQFLYLVLDWFLFIIGLPGIGALIIYDDYLQLNSPIAYPISVTIQANCWS